MQRFWRDIRDPEIVLFWGLLTAYLLPIWLFAHVPSQDGPAHLYNARILADWYWSDYPVFREYLLLSERFDPTWIGHLALAGLMRAFSPAISEKLFLSTYVVSFALAIRYALGSVGNGQGTFLAVLGFPLIYNVVFHMGFFTFSMSLAVYCFFVGYWMRHAEAPDSRRLAGLASISMLLYFTHVYAMAMAYLTVAVISLTWWIARLIDLYRSAGLTRKSFTAITWSILAKPALALVPALVLLLLFLSGREGDLLPGPATYQRLEDLFHLSALYVYRHREHVLADLLVIVFIALTLWFMVDEWSGWKFKRDDALLAAVLALVVAFLYAPNPVIIGESGEPGGGFTTERLNLFPFLALLFWLGSREFSHSRKAFAGLAGTIIALGFLTAHLINFRAINRQLDEYLSAFELVEPGSTVVALFAGHRDFHRIANPLLHASNLAGAEEPILVLNNYEANLGYFPVRYRLSHDPYIHIGKIESGPPTDLDLLGYAQRTGGRIDYVHLWLGQTRSPESPALRSVYDQLQLEYRRIFVSPNGQAELYKRVPAGQ